jgi:hypothetical protein
MNQPEFLPERFSRALDSLLSHRHVDTRRGGPYKVLKLHDGASISLNGFERYIERVFGPMPFNPNDEQRLEAMRETYEATCRTRDIDSPMPPTKEGFERVFEHLTDDHCRCIIWLGKRGSGKTLALNYFLSENFRRLNEECNSTFFRCDVAKLSVLNEGKQQDSERISITEYVVTHSIYVAMKWGDKDRLLGAFHQGDAPAGADGFTSFLLSQPDRTRFADLAALWGRLRTKYYETKKHVVSPGAVTFIAETVHELMRPNQVIFRDLFRYMLIVIRDAGGKKAPGRAGRVINIIDGVDNLLQRPATEDLRESYLRQLLPYLPGGLDGQPFDKNVLVMRNDSYAELSFLSTALRIDGPNDGKIVVQMANVEPEALVSRKGNAAERPGSHLIRQWLSTAGAEVSEARMKRFRLVTSILLNQMRLTGSFLHNPHSGREWGAIESLFNGNIRSFSRNIVRSFAYLERLNPGGGVSLSDLEAASRHTDTESVTSVWRILLEGSITAGASYMYSNSLREVRGRWCPNFFDFQRVVNQDRWGGLVTLRCLQLLRFKSDFYTIETAATVISRLLGYPKQQVVEAIINARDFGMIEYGSLLVTPESAGAKNEQRRSAALKLTMKGEFIQELSFSNLPASYFMALATPLSERALARFSEREMVHDVKPVGGRHFPGTAVVTSILLMRHVLSAQADDLARCRAYKGGKQAPAYLMEVVRQADAVFALPSIEGWKKELIRLFEVFAAQSPSAAAVVFARLASQ